MASVIIDYCSRLLAIAARVVGNNHIRLHRRSLPCLSIGSSCRILVCTTQMALSVVCRREAVFRACAPDRRPCYGASALLRFFSLAHSFPRSLACGVAVLGCRGVV